MHRTRAWLLAFVASTQLTGFFCARPEDPPETCEMDPLGCDPETMLVLDPSCTRDDPLIVSLGDGESTYTPLTELHPPEVHYGFQGGQHFFLGVELDNPELGSPGLEIQFVVRAAEECPVDAPSNTCTWTTYGARDLVVVDRKLLVAVGDHLTTTGYVVILDEDPSWAYDTPIRVDVSATVRDACDRIGSATFSYITEPYPGESTG